MHHTDHHDPQRLQNFLNVSEARGLIQAILPFFGLSFWHLAANSFRLQSHIRTSTSSQLIELSPRHECLSHQVCPRLQRALCKRSAGIGKGWKGALKPGKFFLQPGHLKLPCTMWSLKTLSALAFASLVSCAPYTPKGGLGTNSTPPVYHPASDFDFQSLVCLDLLPLF